LQYIVLENKIKVIVIIYTIPIMIFFIRLCWWSLWRPVI